MGHFSYTCHLSGLPIIGGDKTVLLPLFPKEHWSYDNSQEYLSNYGKGNLCSNDGPNLYFDELFFPIFGEYDCYGRLENIEKDDNTQVIEEFLGLPIESIATVITDCRRDEFKKGGKFCDSVKILDKNNKKHMMLLKTSSTWYRREVYDKLAAINTKDYFDKLNIGVHGILEAVGFSYIGLDESKERYNKVYEKDGLRVYSDGNWLEGQLYSIKDLKEYCEKLGVEIDETKVNGGLYSQIYDFKLPYINDIHAISSRDLKVVYMLLGDQYKISRYNNPLFDKDNITTFYFKNIKEKGNNFLKKNIVDWFAVKKYYHSTGRFLYPIGTSPQDGDHKNVEILLNIALEVLKEDLK